MTDRSLVFVEGAVNGGVEVKSARDVGFGLAQGDDRFYVRVLDAEQMRFCRSLGDGDRVAVVGVLHSFIYRRCHSHHVWIRALAVAPTGAGLAAELPELVEAWVQDEAEAGSGVREAVRSSQALRLLVGYEERCRYAWEAATTYPYSLPAGNGQSVAAGEWARVVLSPLNDAWPAATEAEWRRLIHPDDVEKLSRHLQALASGRPSAVEFRLAGEDERWLRDQARPDGQGERIYGVLQDVTDRKWLESQVLELHKMATVARLVGGLAHDFNNRLTLIMSRAELLRYRLGQEYDAWLRQDVEEITRAAGGMAALTRQLQAFSRREMVLTELLDVNALVADLGDMLKPVVREGIELAVTAGSGVGYVEADQGQVEQILTNLAIHVCERMPNGGRLEIGTAAVLEDEAQARELELAPGNYVRLVVSGAGPGVASAEPPRPEDDQSGVGLSVAYRVAGLIGAGLRSGPGLAFAVYLPRVSDTDVVAAVREAQAGPPPVETVLVVEDEERVRSLAGHVLGLNGFTVLESRSGEEALDLCASHAGSIDLVVSDVMLPGMSGPELVERLAQQRPGIKAVFISGYVETPLAPPPGAPFLRKPFGGAELVRAVHQALTGEGVNDE